MEKSIYKAQVPAKLNLSLAITGKKDGMHTLDMIMYPYEKLCDTVSFCPKNEKGAAKIVVTCDFDDFDEDRFINGIKDKVQDVLSRFDVGGEVVIDKKIPLGAGLGGSSASIVALIKAVEKYCETRGELTPLDTHFLLSLGSDVPYMYKGGVCRVRGVGECVDEIMFDGKLNFEIEVAKGGADSGECYKQYDLLNPVIYPSNPPQNIQEALKEARNDLLEASCIVNPWIKQCMDEFRQRGFDKVYMSGSGSTVFVVTGRE